MAYERQAGNWISTFLFFTSESESPDSYFIWTALSTLASVVQRKLSFQWVYTKVYPNMYITLVGPPGKVHKTSVLRFQQRMLFDISQDPFNTKVAVSAQSTSREALVDQMEKSSFVHDGKPISAMTIISPELMTFFATSQEKMVEFLTDIYDSPDVFEHQTRGSGTVLLRNSYVNFIAATTPSWIADYFDISFIDQGFASRTVFVYESKPRFLKARPKITPEMWKAKDALLADLNHIASLEGEFEITDEAGAWFDNWYEEIWPNERLDYRLSSYQSRKPLLVLKLAMLLTISETDELRIELPIIQAALEFLHRIEPGMARAFSAVGKNKYASDMERIFYDILINDGMRKTDIMRANYSALDKRAMEDAIMNLVGMGAIKRDQDSAGFEIYLPLVEDLS